MSSSHRSDHFALIATLAALVAGSSCGDRSRDRVRVVGVKGDTSMHLAGPGAARWPIDSEFVEVFRYVAHGEKLGNGMCRWQSAGDFVGGPVEIGLEYVKNECIEIRAQGYYRNSPSGLMRR